MCLHRAKELDLKKVVLTLNKMENARIERATCCMRSNHSTPELIPPFRNKNKITVYKTDILCFMKRPKVLSKGEVVFVLLNSEC